MRNDLALWIALCIPFLGTVLGSGCVFFLRNGFKKSTNRMLTGFAGGVMTAASIWSLMIPSMEQSASMGKWAFIPASVGFMVGIFFLLGIDALVPHLHGGSETPEGLRSGLSRHAMMLLAVTIHNIPEGMTVGVVLANVNSDTGILTIGMALTIAIGIAIQNFPEGAVLSMPLHSNGMSKWKAFLFGSISGIVEPLGTLLMILTAHVFLPILPYLLSFAAGAMIYVVVEELIPEMSEGEHSNIGVISFSVGFVLMMILDIVMG